MMDMRRERNRQRQLQTTLSRWAVIAYEASAVDDWYYTKKITADE